MASTDFRSEFVGRIQSGFGGVTVKTVEGFDLLMTLREMQEEHKFVLLRLSPTTPVHVDCWPSLDLGLQNQQAMIDNHHLWSAVVLKKLKEASTSDPDSAGIPTSAVRLGDVLSQYDPADIRFVVLMQNWYNDDRRKNLSFIQSMQEAAFNGRSINITYVMQTSESQMCLDLNPYFPVMEFGTPDREEITTIITSVVSQVDPDITPELILPLAQACEGMTRREVEDVTALACYSRRHLDPDCYKEQKIRTAEADGLFKVVDLSKDDTQLFGLNGLLKFVEPIMRHCESSNTDLRPKGLLLVGPPGSGKSAAARMLAKHSHRTLCQVDFGSIRNKWVGETESRLDRAFKLVESLAPAVLFLD